MEKHLKEYFSALAISFMALTLTYLLSRHFSVVFASSTVGIVFGLIFYKKFDYSAVAFASSFAGMTKLSLINSASWFVVVPFVICTLYYISKNTLVGFGGKLGTIAYISVIVFVLMGSIWS